MVDDKDTIQSYLLAMEGAATDPQSRLSVTWSTARRRRGPS